MAYKEQVWVIKSKPGGVVQIVRGAFTSREAAEESIPDYEKQYLGVDYMVVRD